MLHSLCMQDALISQMRWGPKETEGVAVEDVDWATSDKTVVAASDGSIRIYDLSFQLCQSSFTQAEFKGQLSVQSLLYYTMIMNV